MEFGSISIWIRTIPWGCRLAFPLGKPIHRHHCHQILIKYSSYSLSSYSSYSSSNINYRTLTMHRYEILLNQPHAYHHHCQISLLSLPWICQSGSLIKFYTNSGEFGVIKVMMRPIDNKMECNQISQMCLLPYWRISSRPDRCAGHHQHSSMTSSPLTSSTSSGLVPRLA